MKALILFLSFVCVAAFAKRAPPPVVKPLVRAGNEYRFETEQSDCRSGGSCGMQAFLVSTNVKSGKVNWKTELYQKLFDPNLETDVQTIMPASLKVVKYRAIAVDEMGLRYVVNLKTGMLVEPLKPVIYPAQKH